MADNLGRPSGLSTVYDPLVMAAMQSRIAELAEQVKALDDRLRAIESKLGVTAPAGTNPASARPRQALAAEFRQRQRLDWRPPVVAQE